MFYYVSGEPTIARFCNTNVVTLTNVALQVCNKQLTSAVKILINTHITKQAYLMLTNVGIILHYIILYCYILYYTILCTFHK